MKPQLYLGILLILASCGSNESVKVSVSEINNVKSSMQFEDSLPVSNYEMYIDHSCSFDIDLIDTTVYSFTSDIQADNAANKIMKLTGLPANFELKSASVPNACAVVKCDDVGNCKRFILYSQEFMENIKDETRTHYAEFGVLAHEIGHHLAGHTLNNKGSRYDIETEADKFAGFMLYKLGATITEVKQCYSNLPIEGSSSHPSKSARVAAVSAGYYDAKRSGVSIDRTNSMKNIASENNIVDISKNTDVSEVDRINRLEVITKNLGRMNWHEANEACKALGEGWRLPTKEELNILYEQKKANSSPGVYYWSSTEQDKVDAWVQDFNDGFQGSYSKSYLNHVQAIRDL